MTSGGQVHRVPVTTDLSGAEIALVIHEITGRRDGPTLAALAILDGFDFLYIAAIEGSGLKASARMGERRAAHATASGKVILSDLAPYQLEALLLSHPLQPLTPYTITDVNLLRRKLEEARIKGFAG